MKITYTKEFELTHEEIVDVLSAGLTGSEWFAVDWNADDGNEIKAKHTGKELCIEDILAYLLEDGKSFILSDTEEDKDYIIDAEKFAKGVELYEKDKGISISKALDKGDFDLWEGDAVLQYSAFGEVIYG